jgi:hypothetical protein
MAKIIITQAAEERLTELIQVLYKEEYFGFLESCEDYVNKIYDFIATLPQRQPYTTKNNRFGNSYSRYKANQHTTWYIIFESDGESYLIKNIVNNHSAEYPLYIGV